MRITPQQLQIQLQSLKQDKVSTKSIKVGDILKALVVKVDSNHLTLALNDHTQVQARVEDAGRFSAGENLEFQVVAKDEGPIQVEVLRAQPHVASQEEVKVQLQTLNLDMKAENIKAVEVLRSLAMPVNRENVQTLTQNFKALNLIYNQIDQASQGQGEITKDDVISMMEKPIEGMGQPEMDQPVRAIDLPIKDLAVKLLRTLPDAQPVQGDQVSHKEGPRLDTAVVKDLMGLIVDHENQGFKMEDTMAKVTQLMQLSKPITLNSLSLLDKLSFDQTITRQMDQLADSLLRGGFDKGHSLIGTLKGLAIGPETQSLDVQEYFEVLLKELDDVREGLPKSIQGQVENLKAGIRFLEQDQPQVSWIQIPFEMDQKTRHLDLLVREDYKQDKGGNKKTKLLIALNTHHMNLVQSLIELNPKSLDITIRVEDDRIEALFNKYLHELKDSLEGIKDQVDIRVVNRSIINYREFVQDDNLDGFSMKV